MASSENVPHVQARFFTRQEQYVYVLVILMYVSMCVQSVDIKNVEIFCDSNVNNETTSYVNTDLIILMRCDSTSTTTATTSV